jgi:hypothetical protein
MITLRYRTLIAFLAGVTLVIGVGFAFQSWRADAAPGDSDATLVPITPCRLVDTRPAPNRIGPNGAFGIGDTKTIAARGSKGQCTLPSDAVALSLNVTAVGATAPTFLTVWPGGPLPTASSLNPFPGEPPTPNAVAVQLSAGGTFNIYNLAGTVNVIVDVNGYYTKSSLQQISQRLTALEAARPFIVASDPIDSVTALATPTAIREVTVAAPATVGGPVAVVASGYMTENTEGQVVSCGLLDAVADPFGSGSEVRWRNPTNGRYSHVSASRVFELAAGQTATYYLVCLNSAPGGTTPIGSPQVTAIFTPGATP